MSLCVVILSPVMSIWDHSVFCSSFTKLSFAKGFQITLFNTLSLFPSNSTFSNNSVIEILLFITEKLE
ncbi:MAG: alpha/beta hydrolase, partial [Bartonella sp.]|nr:alpha/beta hydrolase [Bartonella sp.]